MFSASCGKSSGIPQESGFPHAKDPEVSELFKARAEEVIGPLLRISRHDEGGVGDEICTAGKLTQECPEPLKVRVHSHSARETLKITGLDGNLTLVGFVKGTNSPAVALP